MNLNHELAVPEIRLVSICIFSHSGSGLFHHVFTRFKKAILISETRKNECESDATRSEEIDLLTDA